MAIPDEVERLLTQASAERARGNWMSARHLIEQALQRAPDRADIHELLGDVLRAVGDLSAALESYRRARELAPDRPSAEEKWAQTLLELQKPELPKEVPFLPKNPNLAAALSAVLPGSGQVYNEQWLKGVLFGVLTLFSAGYFMQLFLNLRRSTSPLPSFEQVQQQMEQLSTGQILLMVLLGLVALGMWTYSLIDAYRTAQRFQQLQAAQQEQTKSSPTSSEEGGQLF